MDKNTEQEGQSVETKLGLIAKRAADEPDCRFNNLMHLINAEVLKANYQQLGRNRAKGVDEVSWQEYGKQLESNIEGLLGRMKKMSYRPQAVRRVYIPKENGKQRPIGIPATEDKIVQKAMSKIMEAIYEEDFHDSSYGFRPGRSCHQALKKIGELIQWRAIGYVVEADIKGFFDKVDHKKLIEAMSIRISDSKFLRYVVRFLKSGYMEEEVIKESKEGTPQGGNLSPMLANVFLHYVLDEWFEKEVKTRLKGQSYLVRYCDDFVILMQGKTEAQQVMKLLEARFREYGLEFNAEKTKVISFGRYERENAAREGRSANTFDFLGITHFCDISRKGKFKVGRKTSRKRFNRSCRAMNQWLRDVRNAMKTQEWWRALVAKIRGHYQYYAVSENIQAISRYHHLVTKMVFKWLNRQNQRRRLNWEQFNEYLKRYPLPKPCIVHSFYTWSHA